MYKKEFMKHLNSGINNIINKNQIPGVGLGLMKDGKDVVYKNSGYRNVENKLEVTSDTIFGIASMTKSVTSAGIMKLQEQGKLSVHDKVITHLPDFRTPQPTYTEEITIHHLMTHTAGLPPLSTNLYTRKRSLEKDPSVKDYPGIDLKRASGEPIDTAEELIDFIGKLDFKLLGEPGTQFSYSNDGYALLGAIINRASGETFEEYITENILKPAGMTHSTFFIEDLEKNDNVTTLYAKSNEEVYAAPVWWNVPASRAAGALKSTVNDILRYLEIYRNNGTVYGTDILTKESVQQMIHPHISFEPGKHYGYGLRITPDYYGSTLIEHGGGSKGVSSFMAIIPELGITGVALTNLAGVPANALLHGALNLAQDRLFNESYRSFDTVHPSLDELNEYAGTYTSEEGMKFTFFIKNKDLYFNNNVVDQKICGIGEDMFLDKGRSFVQFIRDSENNVNKVFCGSRQVFRD